MWKILLTEPYLNIILALELAQSIEAAVSETKGLNNQSRIAGSSAHVLNLGGEVAIVVSSGKNSLGSGSSGGSCYYRC